jgi:hypothetical protein
MKLTALRSVRTQLDEALVDGLKAAGLEDLPENRKDVLKNVITELEKNFRESSSLTEKTWYRRFIFEAETMVKDLE